MFRRRVISLACLCSVLSFPVEAASIDGSKPFICALSEIRMCAPGVGCEVESAESIDAPKFLFVSVPAKKVTGTRPSGANVDAKIELVRHSGDTMFLRGTQEDFDWNLAIGQTNGDMTLTMTDGDNSAVVFGACIVR